MIQQITLFNAFIGALSPKRKPSWQSLGKKESNERKRLGQVQEFAISAAELDGHDGSDGVRQVLDDRHSRQAGIVRLKAYLVGEVEVLFRHTLSGL